MELLISLLKTVSSVVLPHFNASSHETKNLGRILQDSPFLKTLIFNPLANFFISTSKIHPKSIFLSPFPLLLYQTQATTIFYLGYSHSFLTVLVIITLSICPIVYFLHSNLLFKIQVKPYLYTQYKPPMIFIVFREYINPQLKHSTWYGPFLPIGQSSVFKTPQALSHSRAFAFSPPSAQNILALIPHKVRVILSFKSPSVSCPQAVFPKHSI